MRSAEGDIDISVMPAIATFGFSIFDGSDHIIKHADVIVVRRTHRLLRQIPPGYHTILQAALFPFA